ncbi:hypothetical protein BsIDN1_11740 [Bacillus safensis]|uniref:Uncharacterized protein n=1 Tax=Bacillus safensis TaxID=561879 RepID=A0A5S9M7P6_BACIA|nr:hypothetical protein BsIDN1_11740 [Bacillus safensis]
MLKKELGIELEQDMLMEVKESLDEVNISTQLEAESMNVQTDMKINHETGEITVDGITELENGEKKTNKFNVLIEEIEGNDFTATFVDDETGKEYKS